MKNNKSNGAHRRTLLKAAALGALLPTAWSANAEIPLSTAINRAARFRALSQRCAKAYCQTYLEVLPENARDTLNTAQRLIQVGFEDLGKGGFSTSVAKRRIRRPRCLSNCPSSPRPSWSTLPAASACCRSAWPRTTS